MELESRQHKKNTVNYALIILVGVLLIFSVAQTFQIDNIKNEFSQETITASPTAASAETSTPAPKQQPTMVGGC